MLKRQALIVFVGQLSGRVFGSGSLAQCPFSAVPLAIILGLIAASGSLEGQNITIAPVITRIAGSGKRASSGDGGPATAAGLHHPTEARMDRAGNIYISDVEDHRIRKVDTAGIITTFAGTGNAGYSGDGAAATSGDLNQPYGICFGSAGNVYIADSGNSVIRKVDLQGIITTVAGTGTPGFSGDNGAASAAQLSSPSGVVFDAAGNLLISDSINYRIRKVDGSGVITTVAGNGIQGYRGDNGPAVAAELNNPGAIAIGHKGEIFFADSLNNVIRKIDKSGQITTVAGNGVTGDSGDGGQALNAELNSPYGVALDSAGNLYISDSFNYRIRKVDFSGYIFTVAGNGIQGHSGDSGPSGLAELALPELVNLDNAGNLIFAEASAPDIRKITLIPFGPVDFGDVAVGSAKAMSVYLAINGAATLTRVQATGDFAVLSDSCPLSLPTGTDSICELQVQFSPTQSGPCMFPLLVTTDAPGAFSFGLRGTGLKAALAFFPGIVETIAGNQTRGFSGDGGPATQAELNYPFGIAVDSAGNVFFADGNNKRIRKVDTSGTITTIAGTGAGGPEGQFGGDGGPATQADLSNPTGLALDSAGNLYFSDGSNDRIRRIDPFGIITTVAGNGTLGFGGDGGLAVDAQLKYAVRSYPDNKGNLFIADTINNRIRKVDSNGIITTVAGNGTQGYGGDVGPAIGAAFFEPSDVVVDNAGNIYVADTNNSRVRKVDVNGIITTIVGNGVPTTSGDGGPAINAQLEYPRGLFLDSIGNLYIADYVASRIRRIDVNGVITTVAGGGTGHSNGDGGPATSAVLDSPQLVTVDSTGSIYTSDWDARQAVRKVDATASALVFGTVNVGQTSAPQILELQNIGNAPLNFPLGFSVPDNFQLATVGNDCVTGTLDVSASCNLGIVFAPLVAGSPVTGTMFIFDSALNSPQKISLSGIGIEGLSATTLALTLSATSLLPTQSLVLTAQVISSYKGKTPSGNVIFTDGGTALSTVSLDASGVATFTASSLAVGTHSLAASYGGDASFAASNALALPIVVAQAAAAATITSSASQIVTGTGVSLTVKVAPPASITVTPTGTVTFLQGSTVLAAVALDSTGSASYTTTSLPDGVSSFTATYGGDANFLPATTSTAVAITVTDFTVAPIAQSITIQHGSSGRLSLKLSGTGGFTGIVHLNCTSSSLTCTVAPNQLNVSGASDAIATVTIQAPRNLALLPTSSTILSTLVPAGVLCLIPVFRRRKVRLRASMLLLLLTAATGMIACGGHSFKSTRESITITEVSGTATHSQMVEVIVN